MEISGTGLVVVIVIALSYFTITHAVSAVKHLGHEVKAGVHHVLHPHEKSDKA